MFGFKNESCCAIYKNQRMKTLWLSVVALTAALLASSAHGETIGGALVKAYLNNPDVNTQRAAVRAADEGIPKAEANGLPTLSATGNYGFSYSEFSDLAPSEPGTSYQTTNPRGGGVTLSETLYNGGRTQNGISAAESQMLGAREQLRNTEQNVLLQALTAYMDVIRDAATVDLNKNNVDVLREQLRQTRDRFNVGELTRTDVAQAEASLASSQAQELGAETTLAATLARYRQVVGDEPRRLAPVAPLAKQLPRTVEEAVTISQVEHPAIVAALHGVDVAELQIKINEGALLPTLAVQAQFSAQADPSGYASGASLINGTVTGQLSVPIYDGGATYAGIRQSKEQLGQQELTADSQRDQVRAAAVSAWGANQNSTGVVRAAKAAVEANEVALAGVREEAKVGQRTTLDVLNAQLALLTARVQLVGAEHDQVVNSYTLLSAIGRLSVKNLGLSVIEYDPRVHFDQVRNKMWGWRTPDGK
jgi:outer membrane protein